MQPMEEQKQQEEEQKHSNEKGLKSHTVTLMIATALFFDALQAVLTLIFMGWLVGIFAALTFWLWFRMHGISFMQPKRLMAFGGASLIEVIPILSALPAWTFAVSYLALSSKIKAVVPGADVAKLDIMKK
jgi:hypothetical protein